MPNFALAALGFTLGVFLGMLLFFEVGRRLGKRAIAKRGESARAGLGGIDSSVYALLALLVGFTFSGASARFDHRRELIVQEANAIGTAWLRIALLPAERQPPIRDSFKRYLDGLIEVYQAPAGTQAEARKREALALGENDLWLRAVAACVHPDGEKARMLLLPELNEMFDRVDEERLARRIHPPLVIFAMLALSALMAALFGGYSMSNAPRHNWLVIVGTSATIALTAYLILELEAPRLGLVRVDEFDKAIVELRATLP